jgi:hypothetical protein
MASLRVKRGSDATAGPLPVVFALLPTSGVYLRLTRLHLCGSRPTAHEELYQLERVTTRP